jgi:hypothetical protein
MLHPIEKRALLTYKNGHNIDDEYHYEVLRECGWSREEYLLGVKKEKDELSYDHVQSALQDMLKRVESLGPPLEPE